MSDGKKKPGGFKVPERTLLVGTLPQDPAQAATEPPPPAAEKKLDPMATRLETRAPDVQALLASVRQQQAQPPAGDAGRNAQQPAVGAGGTAQEAAVDTADTAQEAAVDAGGNARQPAFDTADTAREPVPEAQSPSWGEPPELSTADTAREPVPQAEPTAATVEARVEDFARIQARMGSAVYDPPPPPKQPPTAQPAVQPQRPAWQAQPQPQAQQQPQAQPHAQPHAQPQAQQQPQAQPRAQPQPQAQPQAQAQPPEPQPQPRAREPRGPTPQQAAIARGLGSKARKLMERGQYDEALSHAHKAMGMDRTRAEYAALCGYLVHLSGATASGLVDQCLALFDRAIELDPQHAGAHYQKAVVLESVGRTREAMELFERTLDLNPDHLEAARHLRDHDRKGKPDVGKGGGFGRLMKGLKRR